MFSITFTAVSDLPQIRARICMFLVGALGGCSKALGIQPSSPDGPAMPLLGHVPGIAVRGQAGAMGQKDPWGRQSGGC